MWQIVIIALAFTGCGNLRHNTAFASVTETANITAQNFQSDFLNQVANLVDKDSLRHLNEYLEVLRLNPKYEQYGPQIVEAQGTVKLEQKIVLIKQVLDVKNEEGGQSEEILNVQRNVNFLKKMKDRMDVMLEENARELRQLHLYQLCKEFHADSKSEQTEQGSFTSFTKMVPINEGNVHEFQQKLHSRNQSIRINLLEFGRDVYESVKIFGAQVIDDYLLTIRKLLQEVIDEKSELEPHTARLTKLLAEIDAIIQIPDLYEKRQRLYSYLESNLASDYEQFRSSPQSQDDLEDIFTKLKRKGLDLFVTFLFSNFEFIERLHEAWSKLLPLVTPSVDTYDDDSLLLFDVHKLYTEFKRDSENQEKYEKYMTKLKTLYTKTLNSGPNAHIYQLLHNASQNVGSVTLSMLRAKCDSI